ncbi:hypothetical protein VNO78_20692 [Psophocarpus tetragonolobus]|uniref:Uncharacterized protein n=1 Tax=Psophocarpus tetragonolobus TaxID=3891 RepID=A0AAN9XHD4_PSOTE
MKTPMMEKLLMAGESCVRVLMKASDEKEGLLVRNNHKVKQKPIIEGDVLDRKERKSKPALAKEAGINDVERMIQRRKNIRCAPTKHDHRHTLQNRMSQTLSQDQTNPCRAMNWAISREVSSFVSLENSQWEKPTQCANNAMDIGRDGEEEGDPMLNPANNRATLGLNTSNSYQ